MNQNKEHYNKLKRHWKLLVRFEQELNNRDFFYCPCFRRQMSQKKIVEFLLTISDELHDSYLAFQSLLSSIRMKKFASFSDALHNPPANISEHVRKSINTLISHLPYIKNLMMYKYTNAVLEGTINQIKVIKRIAFGYRSFYHFKARILLIHHYNPIRLNRLVKKRKASLKFKLNCKNQTAA